MWTSKTTIMAAMVAFRAPRDKPLVDRGVVGRLEHAQKMKNAKQGMKNEKRGGHRALFIFHFSLPVLHFSFSAPGSIRRA
jgi:hypothetical protein